MTNIEINQLPLTNVVSGANDYLAIDHSNGDGTFTTKRVVPNLIAGLSPTQTLTAIEFIMGVNGYHILTGLAGYLVSPYTGIINSVTILANISGNISVDIWKCANSAFDAGITHPVSSDSICGGNIPALIGSAIYNNALLSGWNRAFNAGDVFAFNVNSTAGIISQLTLSMSVTKTSTP